MGRIKSGFVPNDTPIEDLFQGKSRDDLIILQKLQAAGIVTVGEAQAWAADGRRRSKDDSGHGSLKQRRVYGIGPARRERLKELIEQTGGTAEDSWVRRLVSRVWRFQDSNYYFLTEEGERVLMKWLKSQLVPLEKKYGANNANPLYVFLGMIGAGRINRDDPNWVTKSYDEIEVLPPYDGRYDDKVLSARELAVICGVPVETVNAIYQDCLMVLKTREVRSEVREILEDYAEMRS